MLSKSTIKHLREYVNNKRDNVELLNGYGIDERFPTNLQVLGFIRDGRFVDEVIVVSDNELRYYLLEETTDGREYFMYKGYKIFINLLQLYKL